MGMLKKTIKVGLKASQSIFFGKRIPINVMLSLTDRCQSRCTYCEIPERGKPEMTTEQVLGLVDQIVEEGCERIALWGGEPLLRKDIGEIIRYCKSKDLYVTMDSNGLLLKERLDDIVGLDVLLISWDGPKEAHEANRMANTYTKIMEAIQLAKEKVNVWTLTVLSKNNIHRIDEILEIGSQQNVPMLFQLLYHNADQAGNTNQLLPTREEHLAALNKLIAAKKKGLSIVNSNAYLKHLTLWDDFARQTKSFRAPGQPLCRAAQLFCNVDVDGKVYPCNKLAEQVEAKSFLETGFKEAFEFSNRNGCESCITPGIEFSLMFSFDLVSTLNWMSFIFKTRFKS